jgi:RNA polymerase sigma factor (sigma-70 family)
MIKSFKILKKSFVPSLAAERIFLKESPVRQRCTRKRPLMRENADELIPTRHSLLHRLRRWDDQDSWKDFFDTYWKFIYSVATNAGLSDAEAQDVVQETVISVAKTMPGFRYEPKVCSFKGWLRHITAKRVADQFRKRQREAPANSLISVQTSNNGEMDLADPAGLALDAVWDDEWERNMIEAALQKLELQVNARQYQIFYLHVIQRMPAREVGAAVGVTAAQVYLVKHRLSRLFKKAVTGLERRFA